MKNYYKLLSERIKIKHEISKERKRLNKKLRQTHKGWFLFLDICVIVALLSHMGAFIITRTLVVKETPNIILGESNPTMAKLEGFKPVDEKKGSILINGLMLSGFFWAVMITIYLWYRQRIITEMELIMFAIIVLYSMFVYNFDFMNDLGWLIGKKLYGG